jgi:hypothetical protein
MADLLSYALTTVSDVKESLGIASSVTSYNNLITRKINQATEAIEGYCGRRFASTVYTQQEYDAPNSAQLVLKQRPVITFSVLEQRDSTLNENSWDTVDAAYYFTDLSAGVVDLNFSATGGWNRYRTTYTAGYATIPSDLQEACATLAAYYVNNADGQANLRSKKEGSRSLDYYESQKTSRDLFAALGIDATLDRYANYPLQADK